MKTGRNHRNRVLDSSNPSINGSNQEGAAPYGLSFESPKTLTFHFHVYLENSSQDRLPFRHQPYGCLELQFELHSSPRAAVLGAFFAQTPGGTPTTGEKTLGVAFFTCGCNLDHSAERQLTQVQLKRRPRSQTSKFK